MNALGKFYVYRETHLSNQLNDRSFLGHNKIFESVIQYDYTSYRLVTSLLPLCSSLSVVF